MVQSTPAMGGFVILVCANLTVEKTPSHRPPLISMIFLCVMHGREYLYNFAPWANASRLAMLANFLYKRRAKTPALTNQALHRYRR